MRYFCWIALSSLCLTASLYAHEPSPALKPDSVQNVSHAFVRSLPFDTVDYVSLLKPPDSKRLRSGFVTLRPGIAGEEHSTDSYEELIIVLDGSGELHGENEIKSVSARQIIYVPPHSTHFVKNSGTDLLRYVYIVTKVEP